MTLIVARMTLEVDVKVLPGSLGHSPLIIDDEGLLTMSSM